MIPRVALVLTFGLLALAAALPRESFQEPAQPREEGVLPARWNAGVDCENEPEIQVHAYNEDLYILRQSKCNHFEAPFMFLIFGAERALLIDTGAPGDPPLAATVARLFEEWEARNGWRPSELLVAHSHAHFDHVSGDSQFTDFPGARVAGLDVRSVQDFFGIGDWPNEEVTLDLGGRVLDLIPSPGHEASHLAYYDRRTALLFSGDTFYPGFLFVFAPDLWKDFKASTRRLLEFAESHPVRWILGCHVELDAAGGAYDYGTVAQPNERRLELTVAHLRTLADAVDGMGAKPKVSAHGDFVIYPAWDAPWPARLPDEGGEDE